jgi:UDP-glucose 4-epimerase
MILILGINGFVGRNVAAALIKQNLEVVGIGTKDEPIIDDLFGYIKLDINCDAAIKVLLEIKAEVVLDCISFVPPNNEYLNETNLNNRLGQFRQLLIHVYSSTKYIFISSGGTIYGNASGRLSEEQNAKPLSAYGSQKLLQEKMILDICESNFYILRLSNPFGGDQTVKNGVGFVSKVVECANEGSTLTIYVPSSTIRDYIYINDVVDYICLFCTQQFIGGTYNLSTGIGTSLIGVVREVEQVWNINIRLNELYTEPKNFVHSNVLCNEKLVLETKIKPNYPLCKGIAEIYQSIGTK